MLSKWTFVAQLINLFQNLLKIGYTVENLTFSNTQSIAFTKLNIYIDKIITSVIYRNNYLCNTWV